MYHNVHYLFNILCLYSDRKQREFFFVKILYSLPEYRWNKKGKLFLSKSFTAVLGKYSRTDFFGDWINVFILKIDLCTIIYIIYSTFYANILIKTSPKLFFVIILYSISGYKFDGCLTFLEIKQTYLLKIIWCIIIYIIYLTFYAYIPIVKNAKFFFVKILYSLPEYRWNNKGKLFLSKSFTAFLGKYSRTDFLGDWINVFILKIDLWIII